MFNIVNHASSKKVKQAKKKKPMSKFPIAVPQCNRLSENAGNVAEAPPVADKARRDVGEKQGA